GVGDLLRPTRPELDRPLESALGVVSTREDGGLAVRRRQREEGLLSCLEPQLARNASVAQLSIARAAPEAERERVTPGVRKPPILAPVDPGPGAAVVESWLEAPAQRRAPCKPFHPADELAHRSDRRLVGERHRVGDA